MQDPFMLHLYAALAEKERCLIADRTKAALQAKKSSRRRAWKQSEPGRGAGRSANSLRRSQQINLLKPSSNAGSYPKKRGVKLGRHCRVAERARRTVGDRRQLASISRPQFAPPSAILRN